MANVINMASTAKKSAKRVSTIAAATAAMCVSLGLSAADTEAAKAAMADIAQDEDANAAHAVIISMEPFHGFYA